jgi:hypothetical protein
MQGFLLILKHPIVNVLVQLAIIYGFAPGDVPESLPVPAQAVKLMHLEGGFIDSPGAMEKSQEHVTEWPQERNLQEGGADVGATIVSWIVNLIIYLGIYAICLFAYKMQIFDKREKPFQVLNPAFSLAGKDWNFTTFDCFGDFEMCLYGCCCTVERLADNFATVGVCPFWPTGFSFFGMWVSSQIIGLIITIIAIESGSPELAQIANAAYFIGNGFYAFWLSKKVQEMRKAFGDTSPESKATMDCICMWCCECCEVIRHARHIDAATNTKVKCCFSVIVGFNTPPNAGTVVGAPVAAQEVVTGEKVVQAQPVVVQAEPVVVQAQPEQPKEA